MKLKKLISIALAALMVTTMAACNGGSGGSTAPAPAPAPSTTSSSGDPAPAPEVDPAEYLKGKTIRVVIGATSVTGDTYLTADLVTRMISEKYGCSIKVDPIGAGRALEEIVSTKGEDTIMMFHDMTYLGVLFGAYDADDYSMDKMIVGGSYGYNPGDCFAASASAPYTTIAEMVV